MKLILEQVKGPSIFDGSCEQLLAFYDKCEESQSFQESCEESVTFQG